MEGIINSPFSGQKYIQHEKLTSEDITDQSQVKDTSNAGKTSYAAASKLNQRAKRNLKKFVERGNL